MKQTYLAVAFLNAFFPISAFAMDCDFDLDGEPLLEVNSNYGVETGEVDDEPLLGVNQPYLQDLDAYFGNVLTELTNIVPHNDVGRREKKTPFTHMNTVLNMEYFRDLQSIKPELLATTTGFSPHNSPAKKKRKIDYSFETPQKERAISSIELTNDAGEAMPCKVIYFASNEFTAGQWAYFFPFAPESNVGFDSDDEKWDAAALSYFDQIMHNGLNSHNQEVFILSLLVFVRKFVEANHGNIQDYLFFDKTIDAGLVCRHWSTIALPLVSRILNNDNSPFSGTIRQLASAETHVGFDRGYSHVWNVISLKDAQGLEQTWTVDFFNRSFVMIPQGDLDDVDYFYVANPTQADASVTTYKNHDFFKRFATVTQERLNLSGRKTLYQNKRNPRIMAAKCCLKLTFPDEETVIKFGNEGGN